MGLVHINWNMDQYAPAHKPRYGQKYWTNLTKQRAMQIAQARLLAAANVDGQHYTAKYLEELAESFYQNGQAPDLAIKGYVQDMQPTALLEQSS